MRGKLALRRSAWTPGAGRGDVAATSNAARGRKLAMAASRQDIRRYDGAEIIGRPSAVGMNRQGILCLVCAPTKAAQLQPYFKEAAPEVTITVSSVSQCEGKHAINHQPLLTCFQGLPRV